MGDRITSFEDCPACGAKDTFECYEQLSAVLKVDSCEACGHTHSYDVDGTLIDGDKEHHSTLALIRVLGLQDWKNLDVIVWSGGGKDYAETIGSRLQLNGVKYHSKLEHQELRKRYAKLIAIDDIQDTRLGDVNLIVRNK